MPGAVAVAANAAPAIFFAAGDFAISLGASAAVAGVVGSVAVAAVTVGTTFALSAISKAIAGKPDSSSLSGSFGGRTQTIKQAISPRKVAYGETRVAGTLTFITSTINDGLFHMVITLTGHAIDSFVRYFINDEEQFLDAKGKPTGGSWNQSGSNPRVRIVGGAGTPAGDAAFQAAIQANLPGIWTPDHRQTGCAKLYVVGATNNFPNGLPNVTVVMKGKNDIYDPRTATTGFTKNAALCIRDYLSDPLLGVGEPDSGLNDTAFIAEANICDEAVALAGGGTEDRYTINGQFTKDADDATVLTRMLSACAGMLTYQGGEFTPYTGAYRTPAITFDENHIVGPVRVQAGIGRKELFNGVKGTFINPDDFFQQVPFPVVTNATYLAEDQNERIWKPGDVFFPFTDSSARCQRLAKIDLERARQQITESVPLNLQGMRVQVGDVVNRNSTRMGWSGKPFEVKEWAFVNRGGADAPKIGVDMVLRETAATVYDWNSGEETTQDPAPNTNLPNPFIVASPGVPAVAESLFFTKTGGGVKARATVSWESAGDSYINKYLLEYKLAAASEWTALPSTIQLAINIDDIAPGVYDFRVTAVNKFEFKSPPATRTQEIYGLSAPPSDITGLSISPISGVAILSWDPVQDLDVREGGKIVFRHSSALTGATWGASVTIGQSVPGTANSVTLPLVEGTYMVKAKDSSGLFSTGVAAISTKSPSLFTFSNLSTLTLDPDFSATHSGTASVDGVLKLSGASNMDDWGNIDDVLNWDTEGGVSATGTAVFTEGIDLGSVKTVRLKASVTTATININDSIDSRVSNIDDWENVDGDSGGQTDFQLFVRETDDDPAGSPTWSEWKVLALAEYSARGFQFQADLSSDDPTYNIEVSALEIMADQVA